jgi:predicted TPR repeat methyltransferase
LREALASHAQGRTAQACAWIKQVIDAAPDDAETLVAVGNLAFQLGDTNAAANAYAFSATLRPDDSGMHVLHAAACLQAGRGEEFKRAAARSLELNPANVEALRLLANFNVQQGNFLEAARYCVRILQQSRTDVSALLVLGRCLFSLGDLRNSRDTYAEVLKIDPANALASENLAVVQSKLAGSSARATDGKPQVNTPFLDSAREFWNVETMQQAMFERVFADSRIAAMTDEERKEAWERSAVDSARQVTENLPARRDWKLLEIGCGVGRILKPLRNQFARVDGIDISEKMVRFAQEYLRDAKGRGRVQVNNGYDLSCLGETEYDLVYSTIVFQHIRSASVVRSYLREACRVLRPGGFFRIQVHERTEWFGNWEEEGASGKQYGFAGNGYRPEELTRLLSECGFIDISLRQQGSWIWATSRRPLVETAAIWR